MDMTLYNLICMTVQNTQAINNNQLLYEIHGDIDRGNENIFYLYSLYACLSAAYTALLSHKLADLT